MSVIQHKSAQTTAQNLTVTLDSPVVAGNLLVAVIGFSASNSINGFSHDSNPSTSFFLLSECVASFDNLEAYMQIALLSESYALTVDFANNDGIGKHIHLFEVSGYDTFDMQAINSQVSMNPSVGLSGNTSRAAEFVLAAFLDATHTVEPFTAGSGYTAGETTNTNSFSMFTEYKEISSIGQPSASASIPNSDTVLSLIVTFYNSGSPVPPPPPGSGIFLGSVRVVSSASAGASNPFLGTVKVVGSVPAGASNPYLGQAVEVSSAPAGDTNPSLGEVVVVGSAPAGNTDPFLGSVINT